jgi:hypothetical protein
MNEKITRGRPKSAKNYHCIHCDYLTYKLSDWKRHISTRKHLKVTNGVKLPSDGKNTPKIDNQNGNYGDIEKAPKIWQCLDCGSEYKHKSGLSRHKRICEGQQGIIKNKIKESKSEEETQILKKESEEKEIQKLKKELEQKEIQILKKELEQKDQQIKVLGGIIEQNTQVIESVMTGKMGNTTNNNTTNNITNNNFNLNIFLNEKCKDALNLTDFIDNINLQLSDLETVGKRGYVEGISNIIIRGLNELEVEKRPIHCTDSKRDILYIKEEGEWSKSDDQNSAMSKVVEDITKENMKQMPQWIQENKPDKDEIHKIIPILNDPDTLPKNIKKVVKKVAEASRIHKNISNITVENKIIPDDD